MTAERFVARSGRHTGWAGIYTRGVACVEEGARRSVGGGTAVCAAEVVAGALAAPAVGLKWELELGYVEPSR